MLRREVFAIASAVVAIVLAAIGTFRGDDAHSMRQWLIVSAIVLVATAIVFWAIVPRVSRYGRAALIFGILAVLAIPVFWLGLPPVSPAGLRF